MSERWIGHRVQVAARPQPDTFVLADIYTLDGRLILRTGFTATDWNIYVREEGLRREARLARGGA